MENGATPTVRLVRCPKCRLVLPEVADVPVYRCGGCDTILVGKNRKAVVKSTSVLQETEAAQANKSFHVSEHGESSSSIPQEVLPSPLEHNLNQENGGNKNISSDFHSEGQNCNQYKEDHRSSDGVCDMRDLNTSIEGKEDESQQLLQSDPSEFCNVQNPGVSIEGSLSTEFPRENEELLFQGEANLEVEAEDKILQLEGANSEAETKNKSDSDMRDLSIDNPPLSREITLIDTASAEAKDSLVYSPQEHLEQSQKNEHHGFDRIRSTDTFETAGFVSPSSELSGPLECLSKSTTTKSSHDYDGSFSSCDGMDNHFLDQQIHSSKNNSKAGDYLAPEGSHRSNMLPGKSTINGNSGMRNHAMNLSSDFSYKKYCDSTKHKWHRDEVLEPVVHHHPSRNWKRLGRGEYSSQVPLSQRASFRGYESSGPSCELHDDFPFDPSFLPLEKADYAEQENTKLLRMMCELHDQKHFPRAYHLNGKPNGRNSADMPQKQKQFLTYYHQEAAKEETFYPQYHGIHGQRSSWDRCSRFSRIPFSGGAINTRHRTENSCFCCNPQDWQRSEQLTSTIFRHNRGFCRAHSGHSRYNSYSTCSSSPQRYHESDFSIESDERRYKDHQLKRYMREKHHSVRRHLRPTAGGAPFVTCYHCFRALQLPADFLLFKRKCHQLRCGACSMVLKFSLDKGNHIVPYELVAAEPPPSEVEDGGGDVVTVSSRSATGSHGCLHADPTSCSDDYEHSFGKSRSTDGDPVSHVEFHKLKANANNARNACHSSSNFTELRKELVLKQSQNKYKNSAETFHSARQGSSRVSSEIEDLATRTGGSPLHQLMGYSSPSQVLRGYGTSMCYKSSQNFCNISGLNS